MEILYEDNDIVVINKPAGLVVHSDGRTNESSITEWFVSKYPGSKDVGEPIRLSSGQEIERPGVVHRIDRETSGCLILAKTKIGHEVLKKQFQNREIEKIYHLFVYGNVKDDRGSINLPIKRSSGDFRKRTTLKRPFDSAQGKEALTYFEVLKRDPENNWTFIEAKPKTGRTHQIRVHFQAIHHPILGDSLYGGRRSLGEGGCALGFKRLALHARSIKFKNVKGEEISIEAPYPEDFEKALKNIDL
jgi:23S rRNA pseudouridine1911/1915/1917 synthase